MGTFYVNRALLPLVPLLAFAGVAMAQSPPA